MAATRNHAGLGAFLKLSEPAIIHRRSRRLSCAQMRRGLLGVSIALVLVALPAPAPAACQIERYAELPVTMAGTAPLIAGSIDGVDALFIADSGLFFSA